MRIEPLSVYTSSPTDAARRLRYIVSRSGYINNLIAKKPSEELHELLSSIPVQTKADLVSMGEARYAVDASKIVMISETTGTNGIHLATPRGHDEFRWNAFNQAKAYRRHLVPGIDRIAVFHPSVMSPFVEVSVEALKMIGVTFVRLFPIEGVCDYARILRTFLRYDITAIMTTPSLAYKLLYEMKAHNNGHLPSKLTKILLTGEVISEGSMRNIDRIVGVPGSCRAFVYGSSEAATVMYGIEDGTYRGFLDDFIFEVLPVSNSSTCVFQSSVGPHAVVGRLAITWLRDGINPLIRYDTGDIVTAWNEGGDVAFRIEGRATEDNDDITTSKWIDDHIYSLGVPIYYYDYVVSGRELHVNFVTDSKCNGIDAERAYKIDTNLDRFEKIIYSRVNDDHDFFGFSPCVKMSRNKTNSHS